MESVGDKELEGLCPLNNVEGPKIMQLKGMHDNIMILQAMCHPFYKPYIRKRPHAFILVQFKVKST